MIVGCDQAVSTLIGAAPSGASLHTSQSRGVDGEWNFYASISSGSIHVTSQRQATPMQATTDAIEQFATARKKLG